MDFQSIRERYWTTLISNCPDLKLIMSSSTRLLRVSRFSGRNLSKRLSNQCTCQRALYHSYEHPSPPPFTSTAESILSAAIKHVPESGFTDRALQLGAKDAGFASISTNLFPRGAFDLVAFYLMTKRLSLQSSVDGVDGFARTWDEHKIGVGSRVRSLLLRRLQMNQEAGIIQRWPEVS
jgi:ubiquinone biosynthesis protein COQ9